MTRSSIALLTAVGLWLATPVSSAGPAPAATTSGDRLGTVFDGWAAALGGRDLLRRIDTIHSRWSVRMLGLDGTMEEWVDSAGDHRIGLDLAGLVELVLVTTPEHSWIKDENGRVHEQLGKAREDEIRDIFLKTWSQLLPDRMGHRSELLPPDPVTGGMRVEIHPDGGTRVVVLLDPDSQLPARWESTDEDGESMTTTFLAWLEHDGVRLPSRIRQSSAEPSDAIEMTLEEVQLNEPLPADVFDKPSPRAADIRYLRGRSADNITLDVEGVQLLVPVRVNGSDQLWFLLDTGAQVTVVDTTTARELGLELEGSVSGSGNGNERLDFKLIRDVALAVPGVEISDQVVTALPLRDTLEPALGHPVDGILGFNVISRFVVEIDYANRTLRLVDPVGWEYRGDGKVIPIRIVNTRSVCDAEIVLPDGRVVTGSFYVDTGSSTTVRLHTPFVDGHDLLSSLPAKVTASGLGLGGRTTMYRGRISALRLGGLVYDAPVCSFSQDQDGIASSSEFAGKLGGGLLERSTVILDYERRRIILEPNSRFGTPFKGVTTGLSIRSGGRGDWHTFTIQDVAEGSAADVAGFTRGDILVAVDGRPSSDLRMGEVLEILERGGRTLAVVVRRGGRMVTIELTVESVL